MGFTSLFCGLTSLTIHLYGDQTQLSLCDSKTRTISGLKCFFFSRIAEKMDTAKKVKTVIFNGGG